MPGELVHLAGAKARRFLRSLAEQPFVAVVVDDESNVTVYSKGVDRAEALSSLRKLVELMESEEAADKAV